MAVEGKIPASGPISFGQVRGLLGENEPNYPFEIDPIILSAYQTYLLRNPEEEGAWYWQSSIAAGFVTPTDFEIFVQNSAEAQIVASTGVPLVTPGNALNYNMNRDMFRVITKQNENTTIKASDLRTKDNSYKLYTEPYLLTTQKTRVGTPISNKLYLKTYFDGNRFTKGDATSLSDTVKVTTFASHPNDPINGNIPWVNQNLDVINFFIKLDEPWDTGWINQNNGYRKSHHTRLYYDPADMSVQIQGLYSYDTSNSKDSRVSLIRVEYIPYYIVQSFYQYYNDGFTAFQANFD